MISFAYDESEGFEGENTNPRVPTIIGGVLYDDHDENSLKVGGSKNCSLEELRLITYFKKACKDCGAAFPQDLHGLESSKRILNQFLESLPEYINYGTYNGNELLYSSGSKIYNGKKNEHCIPLKRKGRYQIITLLKTRTGVTLNNGLYKDGLASSTYIMMARESILKGIYLNPYINTDDTKVIFHIPTRVADPSTAKRNSSEYEKLGHSIDDNTDSYRLMESGEIREIIDLYNRDLKYVDPEIQVSSITKGYNSKKGYEQYAFLFLVDIINSYLKKNVYDCAVKDQVTRVKNANALISHFKCESTEEKEAVDDLKTTLYKSVNHGAVINAVPNNKTYPARVQKLVKSVNAAIEQIQSDFDMEYDNQKKPAILDICNHLNSVRTKENASLVVNVINRLNDAIENRKIPDQSSLPSLKGKLKGYQKVKDKLIQLSVIDDELFAKEIRSRMNRLESHMRNLFFYHDNVDYYYSKAAVAEAKGDLFESLQFLYDGHYSFTGSVKRYYSKKWFPIVERQLINDHSKEEIRQAIATAQGYRYHQIDNNVVPEKLLYIVDKLGKASETVGVDPQDWADLYDLYISAYHLTGNPEQAVIYYEKYVKYEDQLNRDEVILTKNRMIPVYNRMFKYKKAEALGYEILGIERNESSRNIIARIQAFLSGNTEKKITDQIDQPISRSTVYKVLGSLGLTYSYMNDRKAEDCFIPVIDNDMIPKASILISLSYLLHYYIETGDKNKYEQYAPEFFGNKSNLSNQFRYILNTLKNDDIADTLRYSLFVYIKAFYRFYKEDRANTKILKKLIKISDVISNEIDDPILLSNYTTGHPWEIIYKYASLLSIYYGDMKLAAQNKKLIHEAIRQNQSIYFKCIVEYGNIEYYREKLKADKDNAATKEEYNEAINNLWYYMHDNHLIDGKSGSIRQKENKLNQLITYMNH